MDSEPNRKDLAPYEAEALLWELDKVAADGKAQAYALEHDAECAACPQRWTELDGPEERLTGLRDAMLIDRLCAEVGRKRARG